MFLKPSGHLNILRNKGVIYVSQCYKVALMIFILNIQCFFFFLQGNSLLLLQLKAITPKLGNISKSKTCDDRVAEIPGHTIIFFHIVQAQHPLKGQHV